MKYITTLMSTILIIASATGCFRKPKGFGDETQLFVIADEKSWEVVEPAVKQVFVKTIQTPQPEQVFSIHWVPPEERNQFATRKNLLLIGTFDQEGEINDWVSAMLSSSVKEKVQEGSAFFFPKYDPWAENQLLLVLAGSSLLDLQQKMLANKEQLHDLFYDRLISETKKGMYEKLEQKEIGEKLLAEYGWTLRVQHDYIIQIERVQDRFIMLRRSLPGRERWLFVHWIEDAGPDLLEHEWALNTRDRLTAKLYEGDQINREYTESSYVNFNGRDALKLTGLWENDEKMAGGPFRTWCFYDEASSRIYVIDIAVYYPAGEKEPFLRQLDVMAHTFRTESEANKVAKEEES